MTFIHLNSKTEPRVRSNWRSRQFESNFGTQALDSLNLQTNGFSPVVIGAWLIAFDAILTGIFGGEQHHATALPAPSHHRRATYGDAILSFPRNFVFHE